ncbi:MAG: aminotransferase class I/II-fold pyridoxal phosphate-dependent enzyme, partial [Coriobacteriales bacterium]
SEDGFLESTRDYVDAARARLARGLRDLGFFVVDGKANYLLFRSDVELYEKMKDRRILIRDCSNYSGLGRGWYRVAVKRDEQNDMLLGELAKALGRI